MNQRLFYIETLGCAKNAVDSEKAAQGLIEDGFSPTENIDEADVVVINTCAFIDQARQESIETTLQLSKAKKTNAKLVVTGCMAQRYEDELVQSLPEVDAVIGFDNEANIASVLFEPIQLKTKPKGIRDLLDMPRPKPKAPWAYLKVAEGCNRNCAFCAIPTFRGKQRSRSIESIFNEAKELVANGIKEIVLVAQDIAWYGRDLNDDVNLSQIMKKIDELKVDGLVSQRLVYIYPSELKGELLESMLSLETSVPYFDLSLQHADAELLRMMKRPGSKEKFLDLIASIRKDKPESVFRSNFIVGFPGETEKHHNELTEFISEAKITWAGFFPYSKEKDTLAYNYENQVDSKLAQERVRELSRIQDEITNQYLISTVGNSYKMIVDSINENNELVARGYDSAPEIDGVIFVQQNEKKRISGDIIEAEISEVLGVDRCANEILS